MTQISVTIVCYNDAKNVKNAVCSIQEHTPADIQKKIYIVDNSTEENDLKEFTGQFFDAVYYKMDKNIGFGGGHNYVLPKLDSTYHAIVNPDILLTEDSLGMLMDFMKKHRAGMAIPRMTDERGNPQAVCRRELNLLDMTIRMVFPTRFLKRQAYHTMQDMDAQKPFLVPFAQGSFLFIETALFQRLGGFDSRYFLYLEDADLCRQVNQISRLYYCPDTTVIHKWERGSHKDSHLRKLHISSMLRYFGKWGWKLW